VFIAALLFTVNLSETIHRHPVFINLLATLVMYSSVGTYARLAEISWATAKPGIMKGYAHNNTIPPPGLDMANDMSDTVFDLFQTALQDILWTITQIATLNLILYVWFTMRSTLRADSARLEKRRTAFLIVMPYIFGSIPLIELIPSAGIYGDITISIVQVTLILLTSAFDIVVLISFLRRRRLMKRVNVQDVTSFAVVVKLLIFSLYGVVLSAILLAAGIAGSPSLIFISQIAQSFSPMLAFLLLGLGRDILDVWLPCQIRKSNGKYMQMRESSVPSVSYGDGHMHSQASTFDATPSLPPDLPWTAEVGQNNI